MDEIIIQELTQENTCNKSLDDFVRTQIVSWVYINKDGKYQLTERSFIDDWTLSRKREKALELINGELLSFGAFLDGKLIGFIGLKRKLYGNRMVVDTFHVSSPHRGHGIGKKLFLRGMEEAKKCGADELYISAFFSKETIAFYRAMGAELTEQPIAEIADDNPDDLQMVCKVS